MTSQSSKIIDRKIITTRKPFYYYLTIILLIFLLISFLAILKFRELDNDGFYSASVTYLVFASVIYANFGQYLATISLYEHKIEINYIFPWNKPILFEFDKILSIENKSLHFESFRSRWQIGGNLLIIRNDKEKVCRFKYNINDSDDNRLIDELKKLSTKK